MEKTLSIKVIFSLVLVALAAVPMRAAALREVTFQGTGGVVLRGDFYRPAKGKPTVILLHGVASVKGEWTEFAEFLSSNGVGVLIYDQRGHGLSLKTVSGGSVDFQTFGQGLSSDWGAMVSDLGEAVRFLVKESGLDGKTIGVGGASIGANIALRYAATHPDVPFALLLSPGINYQGLTTPDVVKAYGARPLFMAASPGDRYAFQSVQQLAAESRGNARLKVSTEPSLAGHGCQMLRRVQPSSPSELEKRILQWVQNSR